MNSKFLKIQIPVEVAVSALSFHPDGLILGTGGQDGVIRIWDVKTQSVAATFDDHQKASSGKLHITWHIISTLVCPPYEEYCRSLFSFKRSRNTVGFLITGQINAISFSENGYHMASASKDAVRVWDLRKLKNLQTLAVEGAKGATTVSFDKVSFIITRIT